MECHSAKKGQCFSHSLHAKLCLPMLENQGNWTEKFAFPQSRFQQDTYGSVGWNPQNLVSANTAGVYRESEVSVLRPRTQTVFTCRRRWRRGGRGLRGEFRQIRTILLSLFTVAPFGGCSRGEQTVFVTMLAVGWSLERWSRAHQGGTLPRFPWWRGCPSAVTLLPGHAHDGSGGEAHHTWIPCLWALRANCAKLDAWFLFKANYVPWRVLEKSESPLWGGFETARASLTVTSFAGQSEQVLTPVLWQARFHPSLFWGPRQQPNSRAPRWGKPPAAWFPSAGDEAAGRPRSAAPQEPNRFKAAGTGPAAGQVCRPPPET